MSMQDLADPFTPEAQSKWYRAMKQYWHPVAYSGDVPEGEMTQGQLLGERILVLRYEGEVRAFMDVCRHKGAAPSLGWIENGCINCPYHGWAYDMEGTLVNIPSRPEMNGLINVPLEKYRCKESAGLIWVSLADEPWGEPPGLPEWEGAGMEWRSHPVYDWKTSSPRRLENFVDFSHFPFVHENILGTRDKAEVPDHTVWREGQMLRFDRFVTEPNHPRMKELVGIDDDLVTIENKYYLTLPGTIYLLRVFPNGKRYGLYMVTAPTGPATCRNFWHLGSDFAESEEDHQFFYDFELMVLDQDQPIVESQWPEHLPDALSAETYIKVADEVTLAYRSWLFELANEYVSG